MNIIVGQSGNTAAVKPSTSDAPIAIVEKPESSARAQDDFGAFFAAPVSTKDLASLLRSRDVESAEPDNKEPDKPTEEKTETARDGTFFPPKLLAAHHDRDPERTTSDLPMPASKAERIPTTKLADPAARLAHDFVLSTPPLQQLHLDDQPSNHPVNHRRVDHHLVSDTTHDLTVVIPQTILTEVWEIENDTHQAPPPQIVENSNLLVSGTNNGLTMPAQRKSIPASIQNLQHTISADGMSLPGHDLKRWSADHTTAPRQAENAVNQADESDQQVFHAKSVEPVAMQRYPRAAKETSSTPSAQRAIPAPSAQQATPLHSTQRASSAFSAQQVTPDPSTKQITPLNSTQQASSTPSAQRAIPAPSAQQAAPLHSTQQASSAFSAQQVTPDPSTQQITPLHSTQQASSSPYTQQALPLAFTQQTSAVLYTQQAAVIPPQNIEHLHPGKSGAAALPSTQDKPSLSAMETRIQKFPTHSGTSTQTVQGTLGGLRAPSKQIAPAAFAVSKSPNTGISDSIASLLSPSGGSEMTSWEAPRLQQAHHASTMLARAEIAPHIARQLVEVMSQAAHRPTEIALSPEELGRVRMSVAAEDGKITVSILTERPETLDLMRRHIDQLGQSFRSMGYDQVSFSFGQGAQTGDQSGSNPSASSPSGPSQTDIANSGTETGANVVNLDSAPTTGIDIRL